MSSRGRFQYGLSTLLFVMTLFAVACSVWKTIPPVAAVLTAAACVGLLGLIVRSIYAATRGVRLSGEEKLLTFFSAIWYVFVALMLLGITACVWVILYCLYWCYFGPR
jgi:hypothetical protein